MQAAAKLLDAQMREIQGGNKTVGLDRVAVLAALNIAHELQMLKDGRVQSDAVIGRSLGEMNRKLDDLFDDTVTRADLIVTFLALQRFWQSGLANGGLK